MQGYLRLGFLIRCCATVLSILKQVYQAVIEPFNLTCCCIYEYFMNAQVVWLSQSKESGHSSHLSVSADHLMQSFFPLIKLKGALRQHLSEFHIILTRLFLITNLRVKIYTWINLVYSYWSANNENWICHFQVSFFSGMFCIMMEIFLKAMWICKCVWELAWLAQLIMYI